MKWSRDDGATIDLLSLVDIEVTAAQVNGWTDDMVRQAEGWAGAVHFRASDNIVRVPPKPDFLPARSEVDYVHPK